MMSPVRKAMPLLPITFENTVPALVVPGTSTDEITLVGIAPPLAAPRKSVVWL